MDKDIIEKIKSDPFCRLLGISFTQLEEGHASCTITLTEDMMNFLGVTHGGLVFTLADAAFAAASNSDHLPSLALDVSGSFLAGTKPGDKLTAKASRINTTRKTGLYRMDIYKNEDLVATFNGTVYRKTKA